MANNSQLNKMEEMKDICFRDEVNIPSTTYGTYGLYGYPAKFIPHVVAYVLENYAHDGSKIFDPFAGYGTTGVVSRVYGYDYELWDLNPMISIFHESATLKLKKIDIDTIFAEMDRFQEEFIPDWSNLDYWYHNDFLSFLYRIWGYYHSIEDDYVRTMLTIPLVKTTRYFSYDDIQRQKLSKSPKSKKRIESIMEKDWKQFFYHMLRKEINKNIKGLEEFWSIPPKKANATIKGGVDTFTTNLEEKKDILITSPPYLQSQEYIRQSKMNLYWLGFNEDYVKSLSKLEMPYRDIEPFPINSDTFFEYREKIEKPHLQKIYDRYFWGVLGSLSRLQEQITSYICLFVGRASMGGYSIPIDLIFVEHFTSLGLKHQITLVDSIKSRRLFSYGKNPATGIKDKRTSGEYLIILEK